MLPIVCFQKSRASMYKGPLTHSLHYSEFVELTLFTLAVSIIALRVNKSPLMDLFFAIDGILMSVALARLYAKYELRFLNHLSLASYTIYLYHGIFQALSLQILMRFTHFDIGFYIVLAFLSGVYGSFLVYKLLYRCRNSRLGRILALISGISVS